MSLFHSKHDSIFVQERARARRRRAHGGRVPHPRRGRLSRHRTRSACPRRNGTAVVVESCSSRPAGRCFSPTRRWWHTLHPLQQLHPLHPLQNPLHSLLYQLQPWTSSRPGVPLGSPTVRLQSPRKAAALTPQQSEGFAKFTSRRELFNVHGHRKMHSFSMKTGN